jgi:hypothetical protein
MKELTKDQVRRQDFVDIEIYQLMQRLNPTDKFIDWNIEMIGEIRDVIREWIVERMKITDEQTFYAYKDD